jgi:hypothetical protein
VNGFAAVFIPSFATSQQDLVEERPFVSIVTDYAYENTNLLTWFMGEIKIEMLSNLPVAEMLQVAESLERMQYSEGESPAKEYQRVGESSCGNLA